MNCPLWIWQQPAWPRFTWQNEAIIDSKSPAVSPWVVAHIFMTQKAKVICGSLFIVVPLRF
ncbi:hypothetical protein [Pseudomonas putida]|uniref:hypothetical protein n=1 Tax=Pseudomonas putida TaxID=303 RepID=UPI002AC6C72D|nr:hypothetical protein [Pseudomonas putida]MDZ5109596.1 hypothetical protein [Pseudomonas putida]